MVENLVINHLRLMITYTGMVAMCCLDWGAQHCVGYIDELAFQNDSKQKK